MSIQYDEYLKEHISGVKNAYEWLKENLPEYFTFVPDSEWSIDFHDESKYTPDEYEAYDKYFYGGNRSYEVVNEFNKAWLHHIHCNPHHWQHWVLLEDDPRSGEPYVCIKMPVWYVLEMISDWWSFSWKKGDLWEIMDWYDKHKNTMKLHKDTRKLVEEILEKIRKKIS